VIVGIGIDVASATRFAQALARTQGLADRLFTPNEQVTPEGFARTAASLAARFAAKEAVAKALGAPPGMLWHDCEIVTLPSGQPQLQITGTVAAVAKQLGVHHWHLSLSHDGDMVAASVVAEGVAP
jgi:holo-[acyl-carrier protein] synthase